VARRWDDAGGIVTPEAVPLQMSEANVGSRAVAWFIDTFVLVLSLTLLNVLIVMLGSDAPIPEWVGFTVLFVLNFLLFFGYPIGFETLLRGRTPGKATLGLRVVTVEGAPVRFRHAAIRAALGMVDFWLTSGVAAVVSTLLTKRHQRLGDLVAGTLVLRERTASAAPAVARFRTPSGAEDYAATIDPTGLAASDYETIREFLLRAATLRPQARADIGRQLAEGIAAKLQHTRPATVSAELFLMCVAARYQERASRPAAVDVTHGLPPQGTPAASAPPPTTPGDAVPPPPGPGDFAPPG
jgi:uncharacterized RDD family membrane protein YckC